MKQIVKLLAGVVVLLSAMTARASDFNAVCSSGQTLYYNILSATERTVEVTYPGTSYGSYTGYTMPSGNIVIPSTVQHGGQTYTITTVGRYAFHQCTNVTGVTFPNTLKSIGMNAFWQCGLTNVTIPSSVNHIGLYAFWGTQISSVTIANPNIFLEQGVFINTPWYGSKDNGMVFIGTILYEYKGTVPANTDLTIQSGTTSIASHAFYNESGITSLTLPTSLKTIGYDAFYGCGGFSSIVIPTSVETIGLNAFENCGGLTSITWNAINCNAEQSASSYYTGRIFVGCDHLETLSFGSGVTKIPNAAFYGCSSLEGTLTLPSSLTVIEPYAFHGCTGLTSVSMPSSLQVIDNYAFQNCAGLTSFTFPAGLDSIGNNVLYNCTNLQIINYNATNCQHTGYSNFYGCNSNMTLNIGSSVQAIPARMFNSVTHLTGTLVLPSGLNTIGDQAFSGCTGLTGSLSIPNSVQTIGANAFSNCTGITSVTVGTGVDSIGTMAFYGMNALTTVNYNATNCTHTGGSWIFMGNSITRFYIGSNVQCIPASIAYNCPNLTSITIPSSVTKIGRNAFTMCGLTGTLTIPSNVATIGHGAFSNISTLTNIVCQRATPPAVEQFMGYQYIFTGCWNVPLKVPCSSVSAYQSAPGWSNFANISGIGGCSYTVSLSVNHSYMGSVSGGGSYTQGATATISATPYSGYHFDHWSDGSSDNPRTITVTGNVSLTAYFAQDEVQTYTVTLRANDVYMGTVSGAGTYTAGSTATVSATPYSGYHFDHWSDGSSDNPRTITVTGNVSLTAYFAQDEVQTYTVTLRANDVYMGTVSGAGMYEAGSMATISATPYSGYRFDHWNDGFTDNPRTFTVNRDISLTAYFVRSTQYFTVTLTANDYSMGTVTGSGQYEQGVTATCAAIPYNGYHFERWNDGITQNPRNIIVNNNVELVAYFVSNVGIDDVDGTDGVLYVEGLGIHIDEASGEDISVYTVDGRIVASLPNTARHAVIAVPSAGVYVVKVGHSPVRKVVVR